MANQIARNLAHRPHDEAVEEIATHLKAYWEARMLAEMDAHLLAGATDVDPLAVEAFALLRARSASA
jgi:formate dehydrogenase subunit delta